MLGAFRVVVDGRAVPDAAWRRTKAAGLVKILALAEGRRLHRDAVADLLWPDLSAPAAAANLRKAMHFARTALGSSDSVQARGDLLVLLPDADVESQRGRIWPFLLHAVVALLLAGAGMLVQAWCRLRPRDDEDDDTDAA